MMGMLGYISHIDMSRKYSIFCLGFSLYCYMLPQNNCSYLSARYGIVEFSPWKHVGNSVRRRDFLARRTTVPD